ncbi:MAG: HNH endonuclease, partial [Hyphomonadaceae bacterium]|nr:HNH endonuclease [Hyphomonadaceae bacterium]
LETQEGRCLGCQAMLSEVEFDHVIPLGLGGSNSPDNWAALCPNCHRAKTRVDLQRIAKAKRQRRFHETGRSRAAVSAPKPTRGSRTFDRRHRKGMNGIVVEGCCCAGCLSTES